MPENSYGLTLSRTVLMMVCRVRVSTRKLSIPLKFAELIPHAHRVTLSERANMHVRLKPQPQLQLLRNIISTRLAVTLLPPTV
jgi:hypothetical protein